MDNRIKHVLFLGTIYHLRYVEYVCRYFNVSEKDLIIYFFLNEHQDESNLSFFNANLNISLLKEVSFFTRKYRFNIKKSFINFCNKDFNKFDKIKLFSTISYDYPIVFKSFYTSTELYLLDDGFGFFSNHYYFNNKKLAIYLRYLLLSILTFKWIRSPFDFNYFTEYKYLNNSKNKIVNYQKLKINLYDIPIEDNIIFILGTAEFELNLVNWETYFNYLNSIVNTYNTCQIFYYPHRKEGSLKLYEIQNLGIFLIENKEPFESYLTKRSTVPEFIIGFMSSNALYELLSKIKCKTKFVLIDNLKANNKMPKTVKLDIVSSYNNYKFIKYNF